MSVDLRRFHRLRNLGFVLLVSAFVLGFFHRIALGVVAPDLMQSFGISAAALGSLAAMYYYVYTALQIPSGVLSDTLGPRVSVGLAVLIAALGSVIFALAESFSVASIGRLMVGFGVSFTFVGLMKFNTLWFKESRYGAISGLTLLIGNAGAILGATPLAWFLASGTWREAFLWAGGFAAFLSLGILLFLRNRPQDAGFPSIQAMEGRAELKQIERHWSRELWGALTNRRIWPGFFAMFGITGTVLAFVGLWLVPLLEDVHGLSKLQASHYASLMLATSAVGSLFAGAFSDVLGRRKPVAVLSAVVALLSWLYLAFASWAPGVVASILFALLGLCAGGTTVCYAAAKEVASPLFAGMAIAVVNTGLFLGAAVAQPMFGWSMDVLWQGQMAGDLRLYDWADYQRGIFLCIVLSGIGLLSTLKLKETYCRNLLNQDD